MKIACDIFDYEDEEEPCELVEQTSVPDHLSTGAVPAV